MFLLLEQLTLFVISLVANTLSAMAGGGAGLLQLPALIFLGLPFGVALATHKIASVALGLGATLRNSKEPNVLQLPFIALILCAGLPGVLLGAKLILQVPETSARIALGTLTVMLGVYSMLKKGLGQEHNAIHRNASGFTIGFFALFLFGILNGSLTSGTGLFVTLWLIVWFGLDFKQATAHTLLLVGLFWNGTGAAALAMLSDVKWDWLPVLIGGSIVGGYFGAHLATKYGNPLIKRIFECVTILVGLGLILKSV